MRKSFINPLNFFSVLDGLQLRYQNPKRYKKLAITSQLINQGVNPSNFKKMGGLSIEAYRLFYNILSARQKAQNDFLITKNFSNSTQPLSILQNESLGSKRKALVLMVDFNDKNGQNSHQDFQKLLFSQGNAIPSSLREYYHEVSNYNFDINGDVFGWFRADGNYCSYSDDLNQNSRSWVLPNAQRLVRETIIKARNSGINFSNYDSNGDGKVDTLIVIFAGEGADDKFIAETNRSKCYNIYPHYNQFANPIRIQNGIEVDNYILMHELPFEDVGGYCHEVGHNLGLPDLYLSDHSSTVVGEWCLMGIGDRNNDGKSPAHLSALCRIHLGFAKPVIINGNLNRYSILNITNSNHIYRIDVPGTDGKEYFLIENRQKKGFDSYLPGFGLLIWHVDETMAVDYFPNYDPSRYFVCLKQADGLDDLEVRIITGEMPKITERDWEGDDGDVFPGKTSNRTFNAVSNPSSNSNDGNPSCVEIISISDSKPVMEAQISIECTRSVGLKLQGLKTSLFKFEPKKDGCLEIIKEETGLNNYHEGYYAGYNAGYNDGYNEGIKLIKK